MVHHYPDRSVESAGRDRAIRFMYPGITYKAVERTVADFSSPGNLPEDIVEAIKAMEITRFGTADKALSFSSYEYFHKESERLFGNWNELNNRESDKVGVELERVQHDPALRRQVWDDWQRLQADSWIALTQRLTGLFWTFFENPKNRKKEWQ